MFKYVCAALVVLSTFYCSATHASQEAQRFGTCLTDSMTGKERKNLAKWIFLGMSTHSTIRPYANVTEDDIDEINQYVGSLITRLVTEDCPEQAKAAADLTVAAAFEQAFKIVGEVAMQELMTEPSVGQSLGAFEKYLDQQKFNDVFQ